MFAKLGISSLLELNVTMSRTMSYAKFAIGVDYSNNDAIPDKVRDTRAHGNHSNITQVLTRIYSRK